MEPYRIVSEHAVYFVTFTISEWLPIFVSEHPCQIVVESLNHCHHHKNLRINAYVIMPTHMHAILFDAAFDAERLNRSITDFRKFTGRQLSDYCTAHFPILDRALRASAGQDRARQCWQPTRHPEAIYTEHFWRQKIEYLHNNPVRKGLVRESTHWRYSSAAYWFGETKESEIILTPLEF